HLGRLANVNDLPAIDPAFSDERLQNIIQYFSINPTEMEKELHVYAATLLDEGKTRQAWQVLLAGEGL
ncbi:MAG: flavin reductase family protein, partial [Sediminibacterium sp.]|nr:flavin reductase family protein [Sediminibacterium sp.]